MLDFETVLPERVGDGAPVAVLLHGRGSDLHDLQGLAPGLPSDLVLVTPRAPFPGRPWGYGPGWAWYRYIAEDRVVPETLEESLEELDRLLEALPSGLPVEPGPVGLGGFSQGGTVSLAYALRHPGVPAFVLNFSGFVPRVPGLEVSAETVADTPLFWGHGRNDPAIPHALAVRGREALARAGARLTVRDYPMGHQISREELADASRWLEEVLEGEGVEEG